MDCSPFNIKHYKSNGALRCEWAKVDGTYPVETIVTAKVSGNTISCDFGYFNMVLNTSTGVMTYQYADGQGGYPIKTFQAV